MSTKLTAASNQAKSVVHWSMGNLSHYHSHCNLNRNQNCVIGLAKLLF